MKPHLLLAVPLIALASVTVASSLDRGGQNATVRADAVVKAYDKNPVAADQLYKGKVFTIGGTVEKVESGEQVYLLLKADAAENIYGVKCVFANTAGLASLVAGKPVSVRGTIDGKRGLYVLVTDCSFPR